ncbi:hypothetical protein [Primorskyibacter sp. S87]|uniref:hypothetical protein n=1 Tax=Primorskyibacter sp. S87 TaxID=3415126 RepID=UPI003C7A99D3
MRPILLIPGLGILSGFLAACEPAIPDSAAGVGFNTPEYRAERERALTGETVNGDPLIPAAVVSAEALPPADPATVGAPTQTAQSTSQPLQAAGAVYVPEAGDTAADIANETAAALAAASQNSGVAPVQANPSNPAPALVSNPGISDENDFAAVSARQSIESDAERISRNRAQYEVVAPTTVPDRPGDAGPNVVNYALSTKHPKGTQLYKRVGFNLQAKAQRKCATYASADQAQVAFLQKGGPEKDRVGLDPDGDGYACGWDPSPFRNAVGN